MPAEGPPTNALPAAFGRFRALHQIGTGSFGPVFRGEDPQRRDPVVITLIDVPFSTDEAGGVVDGLKSLVSRVPNHAAVARPLDAGPAGDRVFVVGVLAPGEPLDQALREYGPAAIGDALPRLRRLADALDLAASAGIWHGGLHPRDILVAAETTILTGLGLVPVLERAGVPPPRHLPYTAPEVVDGESSSRASDRFAFAAIAYEWLFGRVIAGPADASLVMPSIPAVDHARLTSAFVTALSRYPAARFPTHRAFVDAIASAITAGDAAPAPDPRVLALAARRTQDTLIGSPATVFDFDDDDTIDDNTIRQPPAVEDGTLEMPAAAAPAPDVALADLPFDAEPVESEPPTLPTQPGFAPEAVRVDDPPTPAPREVEPHKAYGPFTLVATLLLGIGLGAAAGYWLAREEATTLPPALAADARPSFTEAPIVTADPPPAPAAPPSVAAAPPVPARPARSTPSGASAPRSAERPPAVRPPSPPRASPARAAARGALVVQSRPAGAEVSINGRSTGVTPLTVPALPAGSHRVRIERPGYHPWTTTVHVAPGRRARVAASLTGETERE